MPILLTILAAAGAVIFWIYRARAAADAAHDVADMAGDLVSAARRFGFRRRYNEHPVDSIENETLAAGALAIALSNTSPLPTAETRAAQTVALRKHLKLDAEGADEVYAMAGWLINECGGADPAVTRLGKKLFKLGGPAALDPVLQVANDTATVAGGLTDPEREALAELARVFRRS